MYGKGNVFFKVQRRKRMEFNSAVNIRIDCGCNVHRVIVQRSVEVFLVRAHENLVTKRARQYQGHPKR
jgi:hypothetical protein